MTERSVIPYKVGYDGDGVRALTIPSHIPPSRQLLLARAARYADPMILDWLKDLPIYDGDYPVLLSRKGVVHLKGVSRLDGFPFKCGTQGQDDSSGAEMPLAGALAAIIQDTDTMSTRHSWPCRICFALGLLVVRKDEGEEHEPTKD